MQYDPFKRATDSLLTPARHIFPIIPSVNADLPTATKALYVGTGGDVVVRAVGTDEDVTFANVPAGSILPVRVRAIRSSSTASNFVGLV